MAVRPARLHHFLLLAALLQLLAASTAATGDTVAAGKRRNVGKVRVAVYYESLCPDSVSFVLDNLTRAFNDGLLEAADLTFVPYGNAEVGADRSISCQHGPDECLLNPDECLLNTVEACVIDAWPDSNVHFGFITCVEDLVVKGRYGEWQSCIIKLGLDSKLITKCYKTFAKYGKLTDALVPPHKYVPWVVVNGKPIKGDYQNFLFYVCKAYQGHRRHHHHPKVCHGWGSHHPFVQEVVEAGNGVSYNSGDVEPDRADDEGIESKVKMVPADDGN